MSVGSEIAKASRSKHALRSDCETTTSVTFTVSDITVHGAFAGDNPNCMGLSGGPGTPVGDAYGPNGWTLAPANGFSVIQVPNGRICAWWNLSWETGEPWPGCATTPPLKAYVPISLPNQYAIGLVCVNRAVIIIDSAPGIIFSPSPTYTDVTSGTITASGPGFSSAHGMPLFQYFDQNGNLVAQQNATSVASDGNSASGPVPSNISSVPPGFYVGRVSNAASGGSYTFLNTGGVIVGNGGVTIYGGAIHTSLHAVGSRWGLHAVCYCLRLRNGIHHHKRSHVLRLLRPIRHSAYNCIGFGECNQCKHEHQHTCFCDRAGSDRGNKCHPVRVALLAIRHRNYK